MEKIKLFILFKPSELVLFSKARLSNIFVLYFNQLQMKHIIRNNSPNKFLKLFSAESHGYEQNRIVYGNKMRKFDPLGTFAFCANERQTFQHRQMPACCVQACIRTHYSWFQHVFAFVNLKQNKCIFFKNFFTEYNRFVNCIVCCLNMKVNNLVHLHHSYQRVLASRMYVDLK